MRIPPKVTILGQEFDVLLVKDKGKNFVGRCFPNANKIELIEDLPKDKLAHTFLHEVIHAIDLNLNMGLKHKQVDTLALAFYEFLKTNGYLNDTPRNHK
jgi:hypothetical protein